MSRFTALALLGLLTACGGSSVGSAPSPDGAVLLRLAPPVGQVTRHRTVMETTTEMEGLPMAAGPMVMEQTYFQTTSVVSAEGESRRVRSVIDSVHIDASSLPAMAGQVEGMARQMKGFAVEMTMTERGEVEAYEIVDSAGIGALMGGAGSMSDLVGGYGPSGASLGLPDAPVQPGSTWVVPLDKTSSVGGMAEVTVSGEITYRFEGVELRDGGRIATISFSGPMNTSAAPGSGSPVGMDMVMSGELSGEMKLDLERGALETMSMTSTSTGSMAMMGQEITMSSRVRMVQTPIG